MVVLGKLEATYKEVKLLMELFFHTTHKNKLKVN